MKPKENILHQITPTLKKKVHEIVQELPKDAIIRLAKMDIKRREALFARVLLKVEAMEETKKFLKQELHVVLMEFKETFRFLLKKGSKNARLR